MTTARSIYKVSKTASIQNYGLLSHSTALLTYDSVIEPTDCEIALAETLLAMVSLRSFVRQIRLNRMKRIRMFPAVYWWVDK